MSGKIAFLFHVYPAITQVFVYNEIVELRKQGLRVEVISLRRPRADMVRLLTADMRKEIDRTAYFSVLAHRYFLQAFWFLLKKPWVFIGIIWEVFTRPYLLHTTIKLKMQAFLALLRGLVLAPFVLNEKYAHIHATFADNEATVTWVIHKFTNLPYSFRSHHSYNPQLLLQKIRDSQFVLSISRSDRDFLVAAAGDKFYDKIFVNYLGVDVSRFKSISLLGKAIKPVILCVGTLQEKKGQGYLIQACKILKSECVPFECWLIGDGPMRTELDKNILDANIQDAVKITGYISNGEVINSMLSSSVICMPSIIAGNGDIDGIPYALIEAMALGKPCVSTSISGIPELIDNELSGLLVQERNSQALADALKRLLLDKSLRDNLGLAAGEKVNNYFNIEKNAAAEKKIFSRYIMSKL